MVTVRQSWLAQTVEEPIDPDLPICEAGLGFAVRLNKGDFIGRLALLRARVEGITRKLSCLVLDDPNKVVMGKEPVLDGDRCV